MGDLSDVKYKIIHMFSEINRDYQVSDKYDCWINRVGKRIVSIELWRGVKIIKLNK